MPAFRITYTTPSMPNECRAIKWADTPEKALAHLATGSDKRNTLRLNKGELLIKLINIKKL